MLTFNNVQKSYGDFKLNCTMEVKRGYVTALIGANGAGKTTAFKAILDLIHIDGGEIRIFEKPHSELTLTDKEDLGVVFSGAGFSDTFTIKKLVPIMANFYHRFDKDMFLQLCERFELPLNKKLKKFSTGMRAKLNLLLAVSHDARLLILDEPTAGLDVMARDSMIQLLREYIENGERSILISSHIASDLEHFCDDIYVIHEGQIVFHEDTDTILDSYGILKVSPDEFEKLEKSRLLYVQKEPYGFKCLTCDRRFFTENYPRIVTERCGIDDVLKMITIK